MSRLILVTILITVVFSWEDLKWSLLGLVKRIRNQKFHSHSQNNVDQLVGAVLILAFTPVNLVYLMLAEGSLYGKFGLIAVQLIIIGIVAQIVQIISDRGKEYRHTDFLTASLHFVSSVFSPSIRLGGQMITHHRLFGSYIRHLLIPIVFGFVLKFAAEKYGLEALQTNLDTLIIIAVAGLILIVSVEILEKFFRFHNFKLFSYFRIVLGLVILLVLGNKII